MQSPPEVYYPPMTEQGQRSSGSPPGSSGLAAASMPSEPKARKMPEQLQTVGELPEEERKKIADIDKRSREAEREAQEWRTKHEARIKESEAFWRKMADAEEFDKVVADIGFQVKRKLPKILAGMTSIATRSSRSWESLWMRPRRRREET